MVFGVLLWRRMTRDIAQERGGHAAYGSEGMAFVMCAMQIAIASIASKNDWTLLPFKQRLLELYRETQKCRQHSRPTAPPDRPSDERLPLPKHDEVGTSQHPVSENR